jgi:hypothetical protein
MSFVIRSRGYGLHLLAESLSILLGFIPSAPFAIAAKQDHHCGLGSSPLLIPLGVLATVACVYG